MNTSSLGGRLDGCKYLDFVWVEDNMLSKKCSTENQAIDNYHAPWESFDKMMSKVFDDYVRRIPCSVDEVVLVHKGTFEYSIIPPWSLWSAIKSVGSLIMKGYNYMHSKCVVYRKNSDGELDIIWHGHVDQKELESIFVSHGLVSPVDEEGNRMRMQMIVNGNRNLVFK